MYVKQHFHLLRPLKVHSKMLEISRVSGFAETLLEPKTQKLFQKKAVTRNV